MLALTFAGTPSFAQQPQKLSGAQCDPPALKKLVIDELNASSELAKRKIKIVDYKSDKLLVADPAKNTIACHTTMVIANGQKFPGVLTVAAPGEKSDIDWYDDDGEKGLMSAPSLPMPADQTRFVEVLVKARGAYEEARTDFAKGAIRPQRAKAICALVKSTQVKNWIGKLARLTTDGDGKGVIVIEVAPGVVVRTFSTALSDIGSDTLIEPDTELYSALGEATQGDYVKFSGAFLEKATDCFLEDSQTMKGSISSPEFIMRFTSLEKTSF